MNTTAKVKMYQDIEQHGANLNAIFNTGIDNIALCKKLRRIEAKAHHATTCLCNTNTLEYLDHPRAWELTQTTEAQKDAFFDKIKASVIKILGKQAESAFFVNYDPRGYALKLKIEFCKDKQIHKDWGGYGILAPDFTPNA